MSDTRKPKMSNVNSIKSCQLSKHVFSCLTTLFDATFKAVCSTLRGLTPNLISGETPFKSMQAYFPPTNLLYYKYGLSKQKEMRELYPKLFFFYL